MEIRVKSQPAYAKATAGKQSRVKRNIHLKLKKSSLRGSFQTSRGNLISFKSSCNSFYNEVRMGLPRSLRSLAMTIFSLTIIFTFMPSITLAEYTCPEVSRDAIIEYAKTGVGSPYVWGGHKWDPNNRKWGGADCSGYVTKAWMVPTKVDYKEDPQTHYTSYNYFNDTTHWYSINRSEIIKADAFARRTATEGHVMIFEKWDSWGNATVYEAASQKTGIVYRSRYISDDYKAIRRHHLSDEKPKVIASMKMANGSFTPATPDSWAQNKLYLGNADAYDDFYVTNTSLTENRKRIQIINNKASLSTSDNIRSYWGRQFSNIQKNENSKSLRHALGLVTSDDQSIASATTKNGYMYQAFPKSYISNRLGLDIFRTDKDVVYLTNVTSGDAKVKMYLYDAGKLITLKKLNLKPNEIRAFNWKRNKKVLKKSKNVYMEIYSSRSIMVNRRLSSSSYQQATPIKYADKKLFFEHFNPQSDVIYLANPSARYSANITITLINNGTSLFTTSKKIKPRDVISINLSKTGAAQYKDTAVIISASAGKILGSKRIATGHFQSAFIKPMLSQKVYLDRFDPATQTIFVTNPNGSKLTANVTLYNNGTQVYTKNHEVKGFEVLNLNYSTVTSLKNYHQLFAVLEGMY